MNIDHVKRPTQCLGYAVIILVIIVWLVLLSTQHITLNSPAMLSEMADSPIGSALIQQVLLQPKSHLLYTLRGP